MKHYLVTIKALEYGTKKEYTKTFVLYEEKYLEISNNGNIPVNPAIASHLSNILFDTVLEVSSEAVQNDDDPRLYTVIYGEFIRSGSHSSQIVQCKHIKAHKKEFITDVLELEGIDGTQVWFVFEGWLNHVE